MERPEILVGDTFLGFGVGFCTTTSYDQAERWARIKMHRENKGTGYVAIYEFGYEAAKENTAIRRFDAADMEWLLFVVNNRRGMPFAEVIDMHVGPVADDNVYQSIRFFEPGILNAEETVKRLKTEVLQDQWTFHTDKMLSYCKFIGYKTSTKPPITPTLRANRPMPPCCPGTIQRHILRRLKGSPQRIQNHTKFIVL